MMRGFVASAALLLAATCTPFSSDSEAGDSGVVETGAGDGGNEGSADAADAARGAALVQESSNIASGTTKLTVTLPSPPANGHALVLVVGTNQDYPSGIVGGASSWTRSAQSGKHISTGIWIGLGVLNDTPTVTITWAAPQPAVAALLTEWAGLSALDSAGAISNGLSTTPMVTPFVAQPGQLLFAAGGTQSIASLPTNGFVAINARPSNGSVNVIGAYRRVDVAGSYGTSWTMSTATGWDTLLVALH
jgi:hypothetical protein